MWEPSIGFLPPGFQLGLANEEHHQEIGGGRR